MQVNLKIEDGKEIWRSWVLVEDVVHLLHRCSRTFTTSPLYLLLDLQEMFIWMICLHLCLYYICYAEKKDSSRCQRLSTVCFWDFGPQMWNRIAPVQRADNWWSLQKAFSGKRSWNFRIIILANAVRAQRSLLGGHSDHVELRAGLILFLQGLFSHTSSLGYYCLINYLHRNVPFK